jgi:hypothetical protein
VSNVRKIEEPIFLPKVFMKELIDTIKKSCPSLVDIRFHVFVDEFENLLPYQQKVINTHIKHSQPPLVYSVAMKRRGFVTRETLGSETITEIDDYRAIDLEEKILETDFDLFAAEVLILHLAKVGYNDLPTNADRFRDISRGNEHTDPEYKKAVISFMEALFPGVSEQQLADGVFADPTLKNALKRRIEDGLRRRFGSVEFAEAMSDSQFPKESIVCSALVSRPSLSPVEILKEFDLRREEKASKFYGWVDNNFIGCVLQLYEPHHKVCPFYAGFQTFTKLAKGNLRHLLELCNKSIGLAPDSVENSFPTVSPEVQAKAARQASAAFLQEVRAFGSFGNRLHSFVLRIGSLFALSHGRSGQSEPEVNHFSIRGTNQISEANQRFLDEAVKWTVLFESQATKLKGTRDGKQASFEYMLNPIYSPYFNISYRKRRKIELSVDEFNCFVDGDYHAVSSLLKEYSKKWKVDLDESSPTLFSHLIE